MPASWEKALAAAAARSRRRARGPPRWPTARPPTRRRSCSSGCSARGSAPATSRRARAASSRPTWRARSRTRRLQATIPDLEFAHAVLLLDCDPIDDAPVLDLRIRKGVRRHNVQVAWPARGRRRSTPGRRDAADAPGGGAALLVALDAALAGDDGSLGGAATAAGTNAQAVRDLAGWLRDAGEDLVIVYGERALTGDGARALLNLAAGSGSADRAGAGLLEVPSVPNARGMREAGFAPGHGPGYAPLAEPSAATRAGSPRGSPPASCRRSGSTTPTRVRFHPDRALWERALGTAQTVIAVETVLTDTVREHADVVFPGEAYPEKEGTLTNLDGRVQRLRRRSAARRAARAARLRRAADLAGDHRGGRRRAGPTSASLSGADGLGAAVRRGAVLRRPDARRDRRPRRSAGRRPRQARPGGPTGSPRRSTCRPPRRPPRRHAAARHLGAACGRPRTSTSRRCCSSCAPSRSSSCRPRTPQRLGIREGDRVEVGTTAPREGAGEAARRRPAGSVFLAEGADDQPANALTEPLVEVRRA